MKRLFNFRHCYPVIACIVILWFPHISAAEKPAIRNGVIDLSKWDFENQGVVELKGSWEFYWKEFILEGEGGRNTVNYVYAPKTWKCTRAGMNGVTGTGYASYRVKIILPQNGKKRYALYFYDQGTAYTAYINGEAAAHNGKPGKEKKSSQPQYLPKPYYFSTEKSSIELTLHISNFEYQTGGLWYPIYIGSHNAVNTYEINKISIDMILFGILLVMACYHLVLYLLRREEKSPLYFSIFCIIIALRILLTGEKMLVRLFPDFSWTVLIKLELLTVPLGFMSFLSYFKTVFSNEISKKVVSVFYVLLAAFSVLMLVLPTVYTRYVLFLTQFTTAPLLLFVFFWLYKAVAVRREGVYALLTGLLVLCAAYIHDVLYSNEIIDSVYILPFGLSIFIFSQSVLLSMRFSKAFQTVKDLNNSLSRMDKLKDDFLSNTSHELRTPLNGIIGMINLLKNTELNTNQEKYINLLMSASVSLNNIVNDIIDMSKIRIGKLTLQNVLFDLHSTITEIFEIFQFQVKEKNVNLEFIEQYRPDCYFYGDPFRIQQIILNFLSNSLKFTDSGHIRLTVTKLSENENPVTVRFSFEDTGPGIPTSKKEEIFKPFTQIETTSEKVHHGLGIGLTISKQIVELMGGTIQLDENRETGTQFFVDIPFKTGKKIEDNNLKTENGPQFTEEDINSKAAHKKILVVEDNVINSLFITTILSKKGFSVDTAVNGVEALTKIHRTRFDLVLMDVNMPEMNGYDTTQAIRNTEKDRHVPIIAITAYTYQDDIDKCFKAGMDDYVQKPLNESDIFTKILKYINNF